MTARFHQATWIFAWLLLGFWAVPVMAGTQVLQTAIKAFVHDNGLPINSTRDILFANDGTVWLATMDGLVRFDGTRAKFYKHKKGDRHALMTNDVYSLAQDSRDRIWIGTNSRLAYFDPELDKFFTVTAIDDGCDIAIKYIARGDDDKIWGISESGILVKYDFADKKLQCYTTMQRLGQQKDIMISGLVYDAERQVIWLTTELGLERFDIASSKSTLINNLFTGAPFALSGGFKDSSGNFWALGNGEGMIKYNDSTGQVTRYAPEQYPVLEQLSLLHGVEVEPGEYWFAARERGVLVLRDNRFSMFDGVDLTMAGPTPDYTSRMGVDKYGNLWIGTPGGVFVVSQTARAIRFAALSRLEVPDKLIITALTADHEGRFFFGSIKGLYQLDFDAPIDRALTRFDDSSFDSSRFSKLYHDPEGQHFVCNVNSPYKLEPGLGELLKLPETNPLSHCVDFQSSEARPDLIWVASHSVGLASINRHTLEVQPVAIKGPQNISGFSKRLMALMPEYDGHLWVASADNGFGALNLKTGIFRSFQHQPDAPDSLPNNLVTDITRSNGHVIWLATLGGLSRFDIASQTFSNYGIEDGLSSLLLSKILTDAQGHLWISTQDGLNLFYPDEDRFVRFDQASGLLHSGFYMNTATKDGDGNLYFSGPSGISKINPARLAAANRHFDTFISGMTVDKKRLNTRVADQLDFEKAPREIVIEFGMTAYGSAGANQFRYRLDDYDGQWGEITTQTSATFANLPYGTYTFNVQGKTPSGDWQPSSTRLTFSIPAPWYLSLWAFAGYLLLALGFVKLLSLYLVAAEKEKARKLQIKVDEQTVSLQQSHEKISKLYQRQQWLFAQLSHEIRTPLTLMLAPLAQLLQSRDKKHQDTLAVAEYNQSRLVKMLDQLLDIAQSGNLAKDQRTPVNIKATIQWVATAVQPLLEQKEQTLEVAIDNPGWVNLTRDSLEKVLLNLLSNAHKYSPAKGHIEIFACQQNGRVSIAVSDSGPGIGIADQETIFECFERGELDQQLPGAGVGLALVKQLLAVNDGQISLRSKPGDGSCFTIDFPVGQDTDHSEPFAPSEQVKIFTEHLLAEDHPELPELVQAQIELDDEKPTLLLAEDHEQMRQYIVELLQDDYNVIATPNGEEGLTKAIEMVPDVVLSDVMMPKMDGYELLAQLKAHPVTSHIPVLLLTARDDSPSRLKGLQLKADDYIAKPFNADELKLKIHNVLHLQKMWHLRYQTMAGDPATRAPEHMAITVQLNPSEQKVMDELQQVCLDNFRDHQLKLGDIAKRMRMTERQLQRKIKAISGLTPKQVLRDTRLAQAKTAIEGGQQITQVAYDCGFAGYDHFSRSFKEKYDITPKQCQQATQT